MLINFSGSETIQSCSGELLGLLLSLSNENHVFCVENTLDKSLSSIKYMKPSLRTIAEIQNYHIALNSGKIGIEKCAEIISSLY